MGIENQPLEKIDFTGEKLKRKRLYMIIGATLGALVLIGGTAFAYLQNNEPAPEPPAVDVPVSAPIAEPEPEPEPVFAISPLTGERIEPEVAARRPVAIMVENHTASRPHSGLIDAEIIYEVPVEANITRFLAIYQQNEPARVGPERSARVYFLDWVKEYNAVYAHIGQDPAVLSLIRPYGIDDLYEFGAVWDPPSSGRAVEHRAYTSVPKLREAMTEKNWNEWTPVARWEFKEPAVLEDRSAGQTIRINYSSIQYTSEWTYNPDENVYMHAYGGVAHVDASNDQQIYADNVVLLDLQIWQRQGDDKGRKDMKVVGEGNAVIFRDGHAVEGRWIKESRESRTRFVDAEGKAIALNPGKIWINVVPAFENRASFETTPRTAETEAADTAL